MSDKNVNFVHTCRVSYIFIQGLFFIKMSINQFTFNYFTLHSSTVSRPLLKCSGNHGLINNNGNDNGMTRVDTKENGRED